MMNCLSKVRCFIRSIIQKSNTENKLDWSQFEKELCSDVNNWVQDRRQERARMMCWQIRWWGEIMNNLRERHRIDNRGEYSSAETCLWTDAPLMMMKMMIMMMMTMKLSSEMKTLQVHQSLGWKEEVYGRLKIKLIWKSTCNENRNKNNTYHILW